MQGRGDQKLLHGAMSRDKELPPLEAGAQSEGTGGDLGELCRLTEVGVLGGSDEARPPKWKRVRRKQGAPPSVQPTFSPAASEDFQPPLLKRESSLRKWGSQSQVQRRRDEPEGAGSTDVASAQLRTRACMASLAGPVWGVWMQCKVYWAEHQATWTGPRMTMGRSFPF